MFTRFPSNSLTKMIKKTLIVTTDTLSKFSLTTFLMESFNNDNGPLGLCYISFLFMVCTFNSILT